MVKVRDQERVPRVPLNYNKGRRFKRRVEGSKVLVSCEDVADVQEIGDPEKKDSGYLFFGEKKKDNLSQGEKATRWAYYNSINGGGSKDPESEREGLETLRIFFLAKKKRQPSSTRKSYEVALYNSIIIQ